MTDTRSSSVTNSLRQFDDLKLAAEAFRAVMIQSGAVNHVSQDQYFEELRALERALNPLNYRAAALSPQAQAGEPEYIVSQHIGWLKQYVQGMTADNWRDMQLRAARQLDELSGCVGVAQRPADRAWRCFHCDEVFTDPKAAANHFGVDHVGDETLCQMARVDGGIARVIADLAEELQRYRSEDNTSYREFYALGADHRTALIKEEQKGYDRGLADARAEASSVPSTDLGCGDPYCKDPNCEYGKERHCEFCNIPMLSAECCESEFEAKGCPHSSTHHQDAAK